MVDSFVQQLGITYDESERLYDVVMNDEVTKWVLVDPSIGDTPEFQKSFKQNSPHAHNQTVHNGTYARPCGPYIFPAMRGSNLQSAAAH